MTTTTSPKQVAVGRRAGLTVRDQRVRFRVRGYDEDEGEVVEGSVSGDLRLSLSLLFADFITGRTKDCPVHQKTKEK